MSDHCVIPTCTILDPVMSDGAMICDTCEATLVRMLGEIEDTLRIVNPHRLRRPAERGPAGFGPSSPANDDVIAGLDPRSTVNGPLDDDEAAPTVRPVIGTITGWAQILVEESDAAPPRTLVEAVTMLRTRAGWLAGRPWIDEAYTELADVHRQLQAAVGDTPPKPLATCIDFRGKSPCEGKVYWSEKPRDEAQCVRCKRIYAGLDLARLQSAQEAG